MDARGGLVPCHGQRTRRPPRAPGFPFSPAVLATVAALVPALPVGAHAQEAPVTLEGLLSAPFAADMRAAPSGGAVVWSQTGFDGRNLWVAEAPEYQGRVLTPYPEDDGQEVGSVEWLPDGRSLVYVRGGAPNRQGEVPNPTSHPDGAERALWWVALAEGEPVRIGEGSGPTVRPDGKGVAFLRGGNLWYADLDGTALGVGEPRVLARIRGGIGSLSWSPDARRLAFVSNRGTHAFVGVLDVEARTVTWMDPSVDRDGNPVWSPDGTRIAFTRFPTSSAMTNFAPVREARPWSIRVAEVDSGEAREVWRAEEGMGSRFYGITADNPLLWGDGDRSSSPGSGPAGFSSTPCPPPGVRPPSSPRAPSRWRTWRSPRMGGTSTTAPTRTTCTAATSGGWRWRAVLRSPSRPGTGSSGTPPP
jgi:dipeptidyl aminopeptidase/acylaminoacyl peptidase